MTAPRCDLCLAETPDEPRPLDQLHLCHACREHLEADPIGRRALACVSRLYRSINGRLVAVYEGSALPTTVHGPVEIRCSFHDGRVLVTAPMCETEQELRAAVHAAAVALEQLHREYAGTPAPETERRAH